MAGIIDRINELPPAPGALTGDEALAALARQVATRERIEEVITHRRGGVAVDKATRRVLYHIYGSYYQREDGQYAPCAACVRAAEPTDPCAVKCSTSEYKVGLGGDGPWPLGWKRREDGLLMRARPVAVVACDGFSEREITEGAVETTRDCRYDEATGELDCGWRYVKLTAEVTEGGISCHTLLRKELRQDYPDAQYYGVVWEYDNPVLLSILQPSAPADITAIRKTNTFVEWVPAEAFNELAENGVTPTGRLQDVAHDYTTISGNLTGHTTWTAGTYYLTANCGLSIYNLTLDASDGDIVIKTTGSCAILQSNTGQLKTVNTDASHRIICTSRNDDTRGETIAGSSGNPAIGDQSSAYFGMNSNLVTIHYLSWCEFYYQRGTTGVIYFGSANDAPNCEITWRNFKIQYCALSGATYSCSILGWYRYSTAVKAVSVSNISIDNTCYLNNNSLHYGMVFLSATNGTSVSNVYINLPSTGYAGGVAGIMFSTSGSTNQTATLTNVYVSGLYSHASNAVGCVSLFNGMAGRALSLMARNCIVQNIGSGDDHGIVANRTDGTLSINCYDCIAINCDGTGAYGYYESGTVTSALTNCGSYNCSTRTNFDTDTGGITADPQLGNLPAGCVIDTANCPFPDGLAVGNLALEFTGSDTFDNLGIDETKCSMTGWRYAGTKRITPGIYYTLSTFPETFGTCVPATAETNGGTVITVSGGKGWGSTQGAGYVQVDGIDVTESAWSDAGCTFTAPAHAAGTVDVVCVNYRGAVITGAGALTYYSPPPPPPSADSIEDLGTCKLLWREPPNWAELPEQYTDQQRSFIVMGSSTREVAPLGKYQPRVVTYHWTSVDRGKLHNLLEWYCLRRGRLQRFWLPLWRNEFVLAQPIAILDTSAVIRWCGVAAAFQGYERVFVVLGNGSWLTRQVLSATDNLDGTETLIIRTPWDRNIALSDVLYFGRLLLVRHEEDLIEVEHVSAAVARVTLRYRELVHEYDDIEPES